MKKVTLVIISILFILSVSACKAEEEKEYTYFASEPDFGTQDTVEKDFGDFTVTFPSSWQDQTAYFSDIIDEEQGDLSREVLYGASYPSQIGYYSNVSIIYMDAGETLDIWSFDDVYAEDVADGLADQLGTEVSIEQILYGIFGEKEAFLMYLNWVHLDISVEQIHQLVPMGDEYYYYITYTLFADEGRDDIKAIMNSVKFK